VGAVGEQGTRSGGVFGHDFEVVPLIAPEQGDVARLGQRIHAHPGLDAQGVHRGDVGDGVTVGDADADHG